MRIWETSFSPKEFLNYLSVLVRVQLDWIISIGQSEIKATWNWKFWFKKLFQDVYRQLICLYWNFSLGAFPNREDSWWNTYRSVMQNSWGQSTLGTDIGYKQGPWRTAAPSGRVFPVLHSRPPGNTTCFSPLVARVTVKFNSQVTRRGSGRSKVGSGIISHSFWSICCLNGVLCGFE